MSLEEYPNEFYRKRNHILERDNHICTICGSSQKLVIHHKDKNPLNNQDENLITVCNICHLRHHNSKLTPYPQLN